MYKYFCSFGTGENGYGNVVAGFSKRVTSMEDIRLWQEMIKEQINAKSVVILHFQEIKED